MMRYALYFTPPSHHPLWAAGCDWLGRDPETGVTGPGGEHRIDPRRYGFHATLKPPFSLAADSTAADLETALEAFCLERDAFVMPALGVAALGDFLALRPAPGTSGEESAQRLQHLADDCVRQFDRFRAPLSAQARARRATAHLDATEVAYLEAWGYPHVFEHWRFHMTLTDALPRSEKGAELRARLSTDATRHFEEALHGPLACEGLSLFVESAPGADFRLARRFSFSA